MEHADNSPLISVIIPCYNHAEFLPKCIESVLNQTYQNLECIIINDGSSDNTDEVVDQYVTNDHRVRYFSQIKNQGPSASRNLGIEKAKGELITLLDADDWLNTKLYETQVRCIRDQNLWNKRFVIYTDHSIVWMSDSGHSVREIINPSGNFGNQELIKKMLGITRDRYPPLHFNCSLIKSDVFNEIRFNTNQNAYVDLECWYKILISDTEFVYTPIVGMYYRRHQNFITNNRNRMRNGYLKCLEHIYKINKDDLKYFRGMDEMIRYFSIQRGRDKLERVKYLLRNSPIPVYTSKNINIKKTLMAFDKVGLLSMLFYQIFFFDKLYKIYRDIRIRAGKIYRNRIMGKLDFK